MPLFPSRQSFVPSSIRSRRGSAAVALASGALVLVALAGCAAEPASPSASPRPTSTAKADPSSEPTSPASGTPTPTPTPSGTPVALDCDQALTPDDVYAFNANFGTAPDYKPEADTAGKTALSHEGVACGWLNQTSGELIEVAIAQPNDVLMAQLKDAAIADSTPVPTYGTPPAVEGFFANDGTTGEAQAFTPTYWVTVSSSVFFEPGDAQQLVATVVSHLP